MMYFYVGYDKWSCQNSGAGTLKILSSYRPSSCMHAEAKHSRRNATCRLVTSNFTDSVFSRIFFSASFVTYLKDKTRETRLSKLTLRFFPESKERTRRG